MKVQLEKTFQLPASAEIAWTLLQEIEAVAGCMPGARITERIDATHYKGMVTVKLGPATMSFRGEVEVMAVEASSKTLRLLGKGTDNTGTSAAAMDLTARIDAAGPQACNLVGTSEVSMSGKAATFGGRMMGAVADQVLQQFAANFAARVRELQEQRGDGPGSAASQPPAAAPAAPTAPLNGLALLRTLIANWLRSLFSARNT
ncbi:SRPBCC family protein [Caenimonas terrae]|uniref:SRPBCC family protein n=1 Tax=Caenimonas terrae TaxID=696074 RepID=A0ABW0NGY8_9BURK